MSHKLSAEFVREHLTYSDKGQLHWSEDVKNPRKGKRAGYLNPKDGRRYIRVHGKLYQESHIVWLWHFGELPTELDHKDKNRENNKIENLRVCTRSENLMNKGKRPENTSGYKGVFKNGQKGWMARCCKKYLGTYSDKEKAAEAYNKYARETFGPFAELNEVKYG